MDLQEVLQKRRSVRKFTTEKVSEEDVDKLMHAAMSGPSAVNLKPWEFYVVSNDKKLEQLRATTKFSNINAPLAIIASGNFGSVMPAFGEYWVQDLSAATENILLCATDLGLGAVWCGIYPNKEKCEYVKKAVGMSKLHTPLNIIWVGHPSETPEPRDQYDEKRVHNID